MGATAQPITYVGCQRADIHPAGTSHGKGNIWQANTFNLQRVDLDLPWLPADFLPFAGKLIQRHTISFDGRVHRRDLLSPSEKTPHRLLDEGRGDADPFSVTDHPAGAILSIGRLPQAHNRPVFLHRLVKKRDRLGPLPERHRQNTRSKGIEGPGMADLPEPGYPAESVDHVVGGHSGRFIDNDKSVNHHRTLSRWASTF